ncbi:hypothetical protein ACIQWR_38705 [Streptomyces sp. NPDC098789]|uniref:hypothetical protein n=1 Tax=Streptomyces sp. NPDC098789 TaxID=3366098 RepID=UPI003813F675
MSEHVSPEAAKHLVEKVSSRYVAEIRKEQGSAGPDSEHLKTLKAELAVCAADLLALEEAGSQEVAEIAARYAARAQELNGQ